jgi:hypothetical protein
MSRLEQRRARLRAEYGFDFPDDFFRVWDLACRLRPLDPLNAFADTLNVVLVGPFEVLSGRFDGRVPRRSLLLHWRYHDDPPEFFTVMADDDGLHWGYFLDDPATASGCVASYYPEEVYEIQPDGDTLFEALRLQLESCQGDLEIDLEEEDVDDAEADAAEDALAKLRRQVMAVATGDRMKTGEEYTDRYAGVSSRSDRVVAATMEEMGIVLPPEQYRPLSVTGKKLWKRLKRGGPIEPLMQEARQAIAEGKPGAALELGRNLWACAGEERQEAAFDILDEAYAALGRETLRCVLQTHRACRNLPSVDILADENAD